MITFAADVLRFASLQSSEDLAKMIAFFHLIASAPAKIDFDIQAVGSALLRVEVMTEP